MHSLCNKTDDFIEAWVCKLSNILIKHDKIKLLKLDIEGMELDALYGLDDLIHNVEHIIFEHHDSYGDEIFKYLTEKGFRISQLNDTNYHADR